LGILAKNKAKGQVTKIKNITIFFTPFIDATIVSEAVLKKLTLIFLVAFIIRFLLIFVAYHGDLNNNLSWGDATLKYGLNGYYEQKYWQYSQPNQPPLYILLFGLTSFLFKNINILIWYLRNNFGIIPSALAWFWQNNGNIILLKLPSILADLGIAAVIYKFFYKKNQNLGFKLSVLWLFNPITFYNSSIWGQTDPIVNLLGLISIYFLINKKPKLSILFFTLSILFKSSLVIFLPVLILIWILQKHTLKVWFYSILSSLFAVFIISIWFHMQFDFPIWLSSLYLNRFFPGEIGYLTANAFNFWYLVNPGKILDNTKYFGISAHIIGYLISSLLAFLVIFKVRKKITNEKSILYLLAISALISFLFFTRIHERYLYPLFPIASILIGLIPEMTIPYLIISISFLLNMYNLFWAPGIPSLVNLMQTTPFPSFLAIVNLLVFVSFILMYNFFNGQKKIKAFTITS